MLDGPPPKARAAPEPVVTALIELAEDWLVQRGVPLFLKDPSKLEHRLVHFVVCLAWVSGFTVAVAYDQDGPWGLELAGAVALVVFGFVVNVVHRRGKQGIYRLPRPGWMNLWTIAAMAGVAAFDAVVDKELTIDAAVILAAFVAALLATTAATPRGGLRIAWWAACHLFREAGENARLLSGALPLALLSVAFLFLTSELWDLAATLTEAELAAAVAMFVLLGLCFLVVLDRSRIAETEQFASWGAVRAALGDGPVTEADLTAQQRQVTDELERAATLSKAEVLSRLDAIPAFPENSRPRESGALEALARRLRLPESWRERVSRRPRLTRQRLWVLRGAWYWLRAGDAHAAPPLERPARWNIIVVLLFGQCVQILAVSLMMGLFFLVLGGLIVDGETLKAWDVSHKNGWLGLTQEHWKVTAILAAFTGLAYAVGAALVKDQRELFLARLERKATQRLAVRALYCRLQKLRSDDSRHPY